MGTARRKLTGVGAVIREYRQRAGISQDALADRMDMSAPYISMLESGTRHPSIEMLVRLAVALGVRPGQLLDSIVEHGAEE